MYIPGSEVTGSEGEECGGGGVLVVGEASMAQPGGFINPTLGFVLQHMCLY